MAPTPASASPLATTANSSGDRPTADPHTGTPNPSRLPPCSAAQASIPGFWIPIPLSIPAPTGASRGGGRPGHGSALTDLATAAPKASGAPTFTQSSTAPTVPDAAINGVRSWTGPELGGQVHEVVGGRW